jgi:RNA polymerase sigma-70 factor (ECF subfamily)
VLIYLALMTLKKIFRSAAKNEKDLIKKIAKRNLRALETLYDKYAELVYSLMLAAGKEKDKAAQLTEKIFLQIWQKASSFNTKNGNVYRWMLNLSRGIALSSTSISDSFPEDNQSPVEDGSKLKNRNFSKLAITSVKKRSRSVQEAFKKLPNEDQEVIRLAYYNGLNQSEIAKTLNVPIYEVKTSMKNGMLSLVASLNDTLS